MITSQPADVGACGVTVDPDGLSDFAVRLLESAGADPYDAREVADALTWADRRGLSDHGVVRLPVYVERLSRNLIRSPAALQWTALAPGAAALDADCAFGQVAGRAGMRHAIELARRCGVGLVTVRRSNHYAAAGYYCTLAASAGAIGMAFTNAAPKVAAFGGTTRVLGTNPVAFACPTASGAPLLVDFSTSALSGGSIRSLQSAGLPLPDGTALDEHGRPTNSPEAAERGALLPAAGPKGFGLALMVEVLAGALAGGAMGREVGSLFSYERPVEAGHAFVAIDLATFQPVDDFLRRVDDLLACVTVSEGAPVHYPGELGAARARTCEQDGIPLSLDITGPLAALADGLGVTCPW